MKTVTVKFQTSDLNYQTLVNPACTIEEIREDFVGSMREVCFDFGCFVLKGMERCIDVEISEG